MKPFVSGGRSVFVLGLGLLLFAAGFGLAQTFTGLQNLNGTNGAGAETGLARAGQWLYGTTPAGGVSNNGTVFRLQTNGMAFTNLHLFTGGLDGAVPQSGLVLSGPWLYGTAAAGGSQGYGTVFALQTNGGNFTLLYSFTNGSDGAHPQGGLVWSSNVIYGTTVGVGEGYGTVFALNASGGALTNLHTFSGGSDGGYPQGPLVLSGARLYGTTSAGGAGHGTVFALGTDGGNFTTLHYFSGGVDGGEPIAGVVLSGNTLYGAASAGGLGAGTVFAVNTNGTGFTNLYNFPAIGLDYYTFNGSLSPLVLFGNTLFGTVSAYGYQTLNPLLSSRGYRLLGFGTVYAVNTDGQNFTNLYGFQSSLAPYNPMGGLALAGDTLFGTASAGGVYGAGGVFGLTFSPARDLLVLTVQPSGAGTATGGGSFAFGSSHPLQAKAATGCYFTNWTQDGVVVSTAASYTLNLTGDMVLQANFVDLQRPTCVISAPAPGQQWSNSVLVVSGQAADNVAVHAVYGAVNRGPWQLATTTNGWKNWSWVVPLAPGTNSLATLAVDTSGNVSTTNTVNCVYIVSGLLTVNAAGGTVSPNYNGAWLQIGQTYAMTAKAGVGAVFTGWTGSLATNGSTLTFRMASNLVLNANFAATASPTSLIKSPVAGQLWSNSVFAAAGTAQDAVAVAAVYYSLNQGPWMEAATTNNWTNWSASLSLQPGTNSLAAYGVDTTGRYSATNQVKWTYLLSAPLQIQLVGQGALSPNYNGVLLPIGRPYVIQAAGSNGFSFDHWVLSTNWQGGATNRQASLSFTMVSNVTVLANFVDTTKPGATIIYPAAHQSITNPVLNVAGTAKDNDAVAAVWLRVNGGAWNLAASTNNWLNWTSTVALIPGTNSISVCSVDHTGNVSPTNSVTVTLMSTRIIESVSATITAAGGGALILPSGSQFSIPAGVLTNDMVVTLSLVSTLTQQPPSGLMVGVGPTMVLAFAPATNGAHSRAVPWHPLPVLQGTMLLGDSQIVGVDGAVPMMDAVDLSSRHQFIGIQGTAVNNAATFSPPAGLFQHPHTMQFSLANTKPAVEQAPLPNPGAKIWNGANWVDGTAGFDPSKKTLVLVHGMMSTVEQAFGDAAAVNAMMAAGGYQQVVGFDYDWTQGVDTSGEQLAAFMQSLHSAGLASADLEAHSEGVAVALSAACVDSALPIGNLVMLGGPIMGTPAALVGAAVQDVVQGETFDPLSTLLLNLAVNHYQSTGVLPPGKTAQAILSSQFATDLAPGSPVLAADRQCVSNQMADAQSPLGATKLITACGYQPFDFLAPDTFLGLIFGALFPDGYDGIIPTTSAGAAGSGFESFANATPGLNRFVSLACSPLNHTELETNREVISQVASQLKGAPPPYTLTLNVDPPGAGSIIADPGPPYVRGLNSVVMVTAFANSGFIFNGWTGDILSQGGSSASVSMTTNRSVTAHFLPTYTLTINTTGGSGSGTVTASPAGYPPGLIYTNGTKVTLTAHPGVDSSFGAWGGAAAGTETTYKLTINGNETVTAAFNLKPLSLAGSGGLVGDFLGTASGCGFSASLYLDSVVSITLINAGSGNPTVANVSADCDSSQGDVFSYSWQGDMAWNGSQFTGTLTRTENPSRPALQLTVTLQSNGHYTAALSVPFTFYVFNTDGSCTGPLNVFHYPLNNILLVPQ